EYVRVVKIPQNIAFIYDTYVHEDYRGNGIAPFVLTDVMEILSKKELKTIMCHIVPKNIASQKTYNKVGFHRIQCVHNIRCCGLSLFNVHPGKLMEKVSKRDTN
ncbi:MAG: GNAT family N-acetyltransferase, partial [Candidatus Hodarchaeales archaeon]